MRKLVLLPFVLAAPTLTLLGLAGAAQTTDRQQTPQAPQQIPPPPSLPAPQPPFRTEANYVRVDVYPTKGDAPVTDLTQVDFEILENNVPQKIEQFEHVVIRGNVPQEIRHEPNTVAESHSMLENSRARVFVLFLDIYHVDVAGSRNIRRPLVEALDRVIGEDDLVGVMTPEMSATDVTFARKTTTIDGFLTQYWHWGERDRPDLKDPEDRQYGMCYPNVPAQDDCADQNGIAAEMIDRRHEKRALDALQDLVRYLNGVREERKAILAITNGWLLYRPNQRLMRPLACHGVPTGPSVRVDPRTGALTTKAPEYGATIGQCDGDRVHLAQIDDSQQFRDMLDEANRANASFYPVDPRGLAVFDTPLMRQDVPGQPPPPIPLRADAEQLRGRLTSLQTLAEATDGLAIVKSNDLARGLQRVVADLSSYYLLGYYSTGKLDGKFHSITVRVKRPGVQLRARRGYLAATPEAAARLEMKARVAEPKVAPTEAAAEGLAIEAVLRPLSSLSRETSIRLWPVAGWKPDGSPQVWLVGELGPGDVWKAGAKTEITLTKNGGGTVATAHAAVPAGTRTYKATLTSTDPLAPGDYTIHVHTVGSSLMSSSNDMVAIQLPASPDSSGGVVIRRGPFSGNKDIPTADLRFRRNESIRIEVPAAKTGALGARLLDRAGKALAVPVSAVPRDDSDGTRWLTAQVPLYPLAPGDYIIEVSNGSKRTLTPFRIVP